MIHPLKRPIGMSEITVRGEDVTLPKWVAAAVFSASLLGVGYYIGVTIQLQIDVAVVKSDITLIKDQNKEILGYLRPQQQQRQAP